ncbi:molybdopterin molybdotransferase MoeA [[Eubacterium] cellulosolvens]
MPSPLKSREIIKIDEALEILYRSIKVNILDSEILAIKNSLDRVLACDIIAKYDLPKNNQSAVDGYAVSAKDTFSASPSNPILLQLKSKSVNSDFNIRSGEAIYVSTGAQIPNGSDAVVMVEYADVIHPDIIQICKSVPPGEDVSWKGEDIRQGETILKKGMKVKPQDLGMLAALKIRSIEVFEKPKVGILSTGSELTSLDSNDYEGKIVDINSLVLEAMTIEIGAEPILLGLVEDDYENLRNKIGKSLEKIDLLIVTGGTSKGLFDFTVKAIDSLGKPGVLVHGVAMKPGRPTALASIDGKPIINLSGYPVAAMIGFYVFVRPLIAKILGSTYELESRVRARVTRRIASNIGMRSFVRVKVSNSDGKYIADPVRTTGSGILSSMIYANGLLIIPEDVEGIDEDQEVDVILFRPIQ